MMKKALRAARMVDSAKKEPGRSGKLSTTRPASRTGWHHERENDACSRLKGEIYAATQTINGPEQPAGAARAEWQVPPSGSVQLENVYTDTIELGGNPRNASPARGGVFPWREVAGRRWSTTTRPWTAWAIDQPRIGRTWKRLGGCWESSLDLLDFREVLQGQNRRGRQGNLSPRRLRTTRNTRPRLGSAAVFLLWRWSLAAAVALGLSGRRPAPPMPPGFFYSRP